MDINELVEKNIEQSILKLYILKRKVKFVKDKETINDIILYLKKAQKKNRELAKRVYYKSILK